MENDEKFLSNVQAPKEDETIDFNSVKFYRKWNFWENYEGKVAGTKLDWESSIKKIFTIEDLISFWQFWNNYPGSDPSKIFFDGLSMKYFFKEKNRIVGLNLFEEGISPKWEDSLNAGGTTLTLNYEVKDKGDLSLFLKALIQYWTKLMLIVMGEGFKLNQHVNGIRLIDKSQIGKKTLFRIEIWLRKGYNQDDLQNLKAYLSNVFESLVAESQINP